MSKPFITEATMSLKFSDKEYGNGSEAFINATVKYPEAVPLSEFDDVVADSLTVYENLWRALLGQRWAAGLLKAEDLNTQLEKHKKRFAKLRELLKEPE